MARLSTVERREGSACVTGSSGPDNKLPEISNIWVHLTAALPLLGTQEIRQTVGDPLHLLHLRVLHPAKMEDPSVGWGNLTGKRPMSPITSSREDTWRAGH